MEHLLIQHKLLQEEFFLCLVDQLREHLWALLLQESDILWDSLKNQQFLEFIFCFNEGLQHL